MMNEPKRLLVTDVAKKLNFLAMHPQVRLRTRFTSIAALSKACGLSESSMKTAKSDSRNTKSIRTDVERKLGEVCGFDPSWPEWVSGAAEAFEKRYLAEAASPTHHAQPGASAPITPDHPDNSPQFREQEGAGGRPNVTIQNINQCNITVSLTPAEWASLSEKTRLDAETEQKLQTLSREVGETRDVIESFFQRLGRAEDITENWQQKLLRCAEDFRALRAALRAQDPHDPGLRALRDQALFAADAGDIELAKALRSRIDAERKPAVANAEAELVKTAEAKAAWGRLALLEFAYKQAAVHFRDASDMLPGKKAKKRREYREDEARACLRQRDEEVVYILLEEPSDHLCARKMPPDWTGTRPS